MPLASTIDMQDEIEESRLLSHFRDLKHLATDPASREDYISSYNHAFASKIAESGRMLTTLLQKSQLYNNAVKISENTIIMDDSSEVFLHFLPASVIISEPNCLQFYCQQKGIDESKIAKQVTFLDKLQSGKGIRDYLEYFQSIQCDYLIGIGGGGVSDMLKFLALQLDIPCIIFPTSLASHAYCTPKIHVLEGLRELGYSLTIDSPGSDLSIIDIKLLRPLIVNDMPLISAGAGDALAVVSARQDWMYAVTAGMADYHYITDAFIDLIILKLLELDFNQDIDAWIVDYIDLQVLLSIITVWSGSHPASSWEHLFAYYFELFYQNNYLHGSCVALGVLLFEAINKRNIVNLKALIAKLQIPIPVCTNAQNKMREAIDSAPTLGRQKNRFNLTDYYQFDDTVIHNAIQAVCQ